MGEVAHTLAAGAMAGGFADLLTHPICTVKARLMAQGASKASSAGGDVILYRGIIDGFVKIVRHEGPMATYKGIGIVLIGAAPAQALFFGGMSGVQKAFSPKSDLANFSAGLVAQICGAVAWVPMEVIKEKMMIQGQVKVKKTYNSSISMLTQVVKNEGLGGIYRGFWLQQLTYGPFNGLAVLFYNRFKFAFPEDQQESTAVHLGCSAAGYGLAAAITNPFDVVKTRMQVAASNPELFNYSSGMDCASKMLKHEGILSFMDGVTGRIGWLLPRCALAMTGFEYFMKTFNEGDTAAVN
eukprot:CAMPEP_0182919078 /NCGR_PEP_ID=MMETSP0105_2-20130417/2451_1 /TAXON_ID=81532 ORGANISM="Acanthoeca-like sp., Strain 10tr" /NCGR_SAMPLE_ID=MMETSP0105_2 /ASSEMBLY_ACC=CAM_ASM_000205 /LENGTH=296 /DNA_ID=CAMNT_0025056203 /DNA_START=30 /DNA_END=920 /DNA_ORIENTATION=+